MPDKTKINPADITDLASAKQAIILLCNLVESQATQIAKLVAENQKLRDENNRLKGEQGKPDIKGKNQKSTDISSEAERKTSEVRKPKGSKKNKLRITKTVKLKVDKTTLPADAIFKGYQEVVTQELKVVTENTLYRRQVFYSPSLNKTFTADLPAGYRGDFGPGLRALTIALKTVCNMTERKITDFLTSFGVDIALASVDRIVTHKGGPFHEESADILHNGLASTPYQHIDDTSARVNGENWYTQVICNPFFSAYFTAPHKDRLTVLGILATGSVSGKLSYLLNDMSSSLFKVLRLSNKQQSKLRAAVPQDKVLSEDQLLELLEPLGLGMQQLARVKEALGIAYYHVQTNMPIVDILICDDAPQFKILTKELALCWVHDGRHYKKLNPYLEHNQSKLDDFLGSGYWPFYRKLLAYKQASADERIPLAVKLTQEFDELFSTVTGFQDLDERIAKTLAKKKELLLVLTYPGLPLHNNPAELGARSAVKKRDVSLQTRSTDGTKAQDTFLTITETAKKLGVNIYDYLFDRISGTYAMPSLADIILQQTQT